MAVIADVSDYLVPPPLGAPGLTRTVAGHDEHGREVAIPVIEERPLTLWLNGREVLTMMTIADHPRWLALGFLRNQRILTDQGVARVDHDAETGTVAVRTHAPTSRDVRAERATRTSGCALGTSFGDMMDGLDDLTLPPLTLRLSDLAALSERIARTPSLYLDAGAIHGTVLCEGPRPLAYFEDVGRHNAVDKCAGWMFDEGIPAHDKTLYTTGRLTSEMVVKCAHMGIPALVSRSGFTAWGVDIARQVGLTLIGRMRGARLTCLSGHERLERDA
ncbi:MAG: formate dehydrogenase accessory sulfurtransferase FdhD [Paracoccaceae bacterium]